MRRVALIASVGLAFLALAAYVIGSATSTKMSLVLQPHSPTSLTETTHTNTDFLAAAKLHNSAAEPIVSYRLGWVAVPSAGDSKVTLGEPMNVPAGVAPGAAAQVPAQAVNPASFRGNTRFLGFFVSEAKFVDGNTWKADLNEIQQEAQRQAK